MKLEQEILGRIKAARAFDRSATLSDFQFCATEDRSILIHLKTGRAEVIADDENELRDLAQFFG